MTRAKRDAYDRMFENTRTLCLGIWIGARDMRYLYALVGIFAAHWIFVWWTSRGDL